MARLASAWASRRGAIVGDLFLDLEPAPPRQPHATDDRHHGFDDRAGLHHDGFKAVDAAGPAQSADLGPGRSAGFASGGVPAAPLAAQGMPAAICAFGAALGCGGATDAE